jgi:hypothetical protein
MPAILALFSFVFFGAAPGQGQCAVPTFFFPFVDEQSF